jgi:hypothetical protein
LDIGIQSSAPRIDPDLAKCPTDVRKSFNLDIGMRDTSIAVNLVPVTYFSVAPSGVVRYRYLLPNIMKFMQRLQSVKDRTGKNK